MENNTFSVNCSSKEQLKKMQGDTKIISAYSHDRFSDILERILKKLRKEKEAKK
jgi:hypothetical protein